GRTMSDVRPLVLPVMDDDANAPKPAAWLDAKRPGGGDVEPLLDRLTGQKQDPQRVVKSMPSMPQRPPESGEGDGRPTPEEAREQRISRWPPPPGLGALVPGGRSNAPPANDAAHEQLEDRIAAFAAAAVELAIARAATLATTEGQLLDLAIEIA